MKVSIGQAAKELGVSQETLRRWEAAGKIEVERTPNGHRRYDLAKLNGVARACRLAPAYAKANRPTVAYPAGRPWPTLACPVTTSATT